MSGLATCESQTEASVPLLDVEPHLFVRLVKLAGLALRFQLADDLLEYFHRLQAALALVTLDVDFHASVGCDRDVKFALWHKKFQGQPSTGLIIYWWFGFV